MKKVVIISSIIVLIGFLLLGASIMASPQGFQKIFAVKVNCDKAKLILKSDYETKTKDYKHVIDGLSQSKDHLDQTLAEVEKQNFDTTSVRSKLNIFYTKVDKLATDYATYLSRLTKLSDSTCNTNDFNSAKSDVDESISILAADSQDIKQYAPEVSSEFDKLQKLVNDSQKK